MSALIEFICAENLINVLPRPIQASANIPEWVKRLPVEMTNLVPPRSTAKRCLPLIEAMTNGYLILLAADVYVEIGADKAEFHWDTSFPIVQKHYREQAAGIPGLGNRDIYKFMNYWVIKAPKGYSALFCPPANRGYSPFEIFSGIVEIDHYMNTVNLPFLWRGGASMWLRQGTPIAQMIPFRRESFQLKIRAATSGEKTEAEELTNNLSAHRSYYRETIKNERSNKSTLRQLLLRKLRP